MKGIKIDGRYEIVQHFGSGAFGTTFLAQDTKRPGNPLCIIKKLTPASTDPATLKRLKEFFDQEAVILETLGKHEQIPQLLAHIEENQEFYIVQEYIEGHDLIDELLLRQQMTESYVIKLIIDILEVLEFVHKYKVIHRDIKPNNIRRRKSDDKIVLIDFGGVKQVSTQAVNAQGQMTPTLIIGTPGYMPIEQEKGKAQLSSDVYAVGMIAIQALTGLLPNELEEDADTREILWRKYVKVSPKLATVIDKMVSYEFRQRYPTAREALQALQNLSSDSTFIQQQTVNLEKTPKTGVKSNNLVKLILTVSIFTVATSILIPIMISIKQDFLIYEKKQYGIKIQYPESWTKYDIEDYSVKKEIVSFLSPKQSDTDKFQEKLTIGVEDKFYGTLDEFNKSNIQEIKNTLPEANILEESSSFLANRPAIKLVYTGQNGTDTLKNMQIVALKGEQAYIVTYTAKIDDYDLFLKTAEKMIKSLNID